MKNIEIKMEGSVLVIRIDTAKRFGLSKSGKTTIIASTEGNQTVAPGIVAGINVYTK